MTANSATWTRGATSSCGGRWRRSTTTGCAGRPGCVRAYIGKACGHSTAQISRLIRQQVETGAIVDRQPLGPQGAPEPDGEPGFLQVDTVHLGDRDGRKGCTSWTSDRLRSAVT